MKIMKKLLLYIVPLLTLFSCSEQLEGISSTDKGLETTISVVIPQLPDAHPQSRAMALNPQLQNLKLAVFDNNGYLLEYVAATLTEEQKATENETKYGYNVELRPTDFPTYIHFIGNAPENIQYGTETEAIGRLFTEGGNEAYWQRIELPDGIQKDGENFVKSVNDSLTDVRLVRNFAWIQLELGDEVDNFSMDSYCVVNTYNKGSIAPYNTSSSKFVDFAHQQTHADLLSEGYNGFIPAGAEMDKAIPAENTWFKTQGQSADSYAYFIYEREKALSEPSYILVKGTYTPESGSEMANRYYKVDLRDQTGDYFPLIRNFRYKVRITKVMHEGHDSAELAAAGSGSGDVSTAIETEDFTNISNGVARIFVSYTDTTLVAQTDELKLRYKFMVFETKDANGNVIQEQQTLNGENVTLTKEGGIVIDEFNKSNSDISDGWREVTIKTTERGDKLKMEDLIIKGTVTIGTGESAKTYELQRKVTIALTPKYTMQLECDPTAIPKDQGKPFDVIIKVPADLRPSMFPLDIRLEAENQSMTPDKGDDLPVIIGKSIISAKADKTTIGFIKQIHWDDYEELIKAPEGGYVSFMCHFKRNKEVSTDTRIYADNKYFNQVSTILGSYTPGTFTNLAFNPSSNLTPGTNVTFSFSVSEIPSQGDVYVTLEGLELADGEERLVWDSDKGCFKYDTDNLSGKNGSFQLKCDGTADPASVKLSAYHFEDAVKTIDVELNEFSYLTFNPSSVTNGENTPVTFSFNMPTLPSPANVTVTLNGLEPNNDSKLTHIKDNADGTKQYKYTPSTTGTQTFNLKTTIDNGTASVKLEASQYNMAQKTLNVSRSYTIPAGKIYTGENNKIFYIFASDPGTQSNNNGNIGSFTTNDQGYNNADFVINAANVSEGYVYIRYSVKEWAFMFSYDVYYVAKVSLEELIDVNGCDISNDFERQ